MAARRRRRVPESYDSLIDTMTNAVGILVIFLAIMQLGAGDAAARIKRLLGGKTNVTVQEVDRARSEAAEVETNADARSRAAAVLREQVEKTRQALEAERAGSRSAAHVDHAASIREAEREREALEARQRRSGDALERLRAEPRPPVPVRAPRAVRLPDPRSAQEGMGALIFVCRLGRLTWLDFAAVRARVADALRARGSMDISTYTTQTVISEGPFRLRVREVDGTPKWHLLTLELINRDVGEAATDVSRPGSQLRSVLGRHAPRRNYVNFAVWDDSFDTYLEARRVVEEMGFSVGWVPYGGREELRYRLGDGGGTSGRRPPPVD